MAAGGGSFESKDGTKLHLPGSNLNDIANQADDLLEVLCLVRYIYFVRDYLCLRL